MTVLGELSRNDTGECSLALSWHKAKNLASMAPSNALSCPERKV